jgi:diguanylate cyclase (GGDEF)-like protein
MRLLAWLLLALVVLTSVVLLLLFVLFPSTNHALHTRYTLLIGGLIVLLVLAYGANRAGHYSVSAVMTVVCAVLGPWGSLAADPTILHGDALPLVYVVIPVLLCGLLLPPLLTAVLGALQFGILVVLLASNAAHSSLNWPSLLVFVFLTSTLIVIASLVSRQDLAQIDVQTAQLSQQSVRDPLTGLFNRRYLDATLERELQRTARLHEPLAVIMLDIDHFKHYNDTFGHAAGDAVLRALGAVLSDNLRAEDIACRYGGEEFTLLMPTTARETARQRAEQIRDQASHLQVRHEGRSLDPITVSLGVAVAPDHGTTSTSLLQAADGALYHAKVTGRDRVIMATSPCV